MAVAVTDGMGRAVMRLKAVALLLGTVVMLAPGCGSDDDETVTDKAATTTSLEEWSVEAGSVCSEFSEGFVEGEWAGAAPFAVASGKFSELPPSGESAEALVSAMTEADADSGISLTVA